MPICPPASACRKTIESPPLSTNATELQHRNGASSSGIGDNPDSSRGLLGFFLNAGKRGGRLATAQPARFTLGKAYHPRRGELSWRHRRAWLIPQSGLRFTRTEASPAALPSKLAKRQSPLAAWGRPRRPCPRRTLSSPHYVRRRPISRSPPSSDHDATRPVKETDRRCI